MGSRKRTAHWAGAIYFVHMLVALYSEFVFPTLVVPGDAAATARAITEQPFTYRAGLLLQFVTLLLLVFVATSLYRLFQDVDAARALLLVVLVAIGTAVALQNLLTRMAPLVLLTGGELLAALGRPQVEALALAALRYRGGGSAFALAFWGLWLFPFGRLVVQSRFLPRALGWLLMVAGCAYLVTSAVAILVPEYRSLTTSLMMPLYFAEVPIIFWLLVMGADESREGGAHLGAGAVA